MGLNALGYCKVINALCLLHYRRLVESLGSFHSNRRANPRGPRFLFTSFNRSNIPLSVFLRGTALSFFLLLFSFMYMRVAMGNIFGLESED